MNPILIGAGVLVLLILVGAAISVRRQNASVLDERLERFTDFSSLQAFDLPAEGNKPKEKEPSALAERLDSVLSKREFGKNWIIELARADLQLTVGEYFSLHILAAVVQKEASAISNPTREALAAKQARGFAPGTPANLTAAVRAKGLVARQANAQTNVNNRQAAQPAALLRATGANLRAIADQLNRSGYCTRRGKAFHPMGVQRLLASSAAALLTGVPA